MVVLTIRTVGSAETGGARSHASLTPRAAPHPTRGAETGRGEEAWMSRGRLRVYLGAAPGVGKTVSMLEEGHRRLARGTDVVVAVADAHGRPHTAKCLEGLPAVPQRSAPCG